MSRNTFTKALAASTAALALAAGLAGCSHSDSKPTKAEVRSGIAVVLQKSGVDKQRKNAGISDDKWNAYLDCLANESYDKLSTEFLRKTADGVDVRNTTASDQKVLDESANKCAPSLTGGK